MICEARALAVTVLAAAPADPVETPPARRPGSVRRTSTMLMFWPEGFGYELHLKGRARDLHTPERGDPMVAGRLRALLWSPAGRGIVQQIESHPVHEPLQRLVGGRAGGNLRSAIAQELPDQVEAGTPLHLLLDDIAGATLISGFTYFRWADAVPGMRERIGQGPQERHAGHLLWVPRRFKRALHGRIVARRQLEHPGRAITP